ncbi:MAG: DedA family protein [Armatimonadia bacterium]
MVEHILTVIGTFIVGTISAMGYGGIVLLMGIESACIPLPSEVIMPFAGFLVFKGEMSLWLAGLAGAIGCVAGSVPAYYLGMYGGRPVIEKWGRYVLMCPHDLDLADRWFAKHGDITVFIARLLPVVRTFIAFPAGVNRMNMRRFIIYTFAGSFPWCLGLAYAGQKLGENWQGLKVYFHQFDAVIGIVLVVGLALWIYRHTRSRRDPSCDAPQEDQKAE